VNIKNILYSALSLKMSSALYNLLTISWTVTITVFPISVVIRHAGPEPMILVPQLKALFEYDMIEQRSDTGNSYSK